ncbi:MAG: polymerase IV protein [Parcubacteria group bacterium GW2011_GWA2_47_8]|nr:MAG: polymerase IV protein [Parcubacteria group bacterium GW2011_GWA2_47_8]
MPTYLHIDLNCFFASVEQQANPFLRGKPIGIVADPTGRYVRRGVLATASYPAKAKGVKSGMPAFQAKQLCPEIILIGGDGDKYEYISNCFNNIVRRYSDDVTQFSIDEAYMEVDSVRHLLGSPTTIAHNIKQAMREELGTCITCSIGIGPNRILAKLASDLQKPDGLVEITHENKFEVLRSVPLDALAGIGPKTRAHLEALGIVDFDDLYKADDLFLKNAFGVWGINLKRVAQGHESGFFRYTHNQQKSIGHSRTVNANMETLEQLKPLLKRLSSKVGQRARKHGLVGQTVHVQLKYWDFEHWGMQRKLGFGINDDSAIYKEALGLLVTHRQPTKPVRLVGVSISDTREDVQGDLSCRLQFHTS